MQASFSRTEVAVQTGKSTNLVNAGVQTEHSSVRYLGVQVSQLAVDEPDNELCAMSIVFSKLHNNGSTTKNELE